MHAFIFAHCLEAALPPRTSPQTVGCHRFILHNVNHMSPRRLMLMGRVLLLLFAARVRRGIGLKAGYRVSWQLKHANAEHSFLG